LNLDTLKLLGPSINTDPVEGRSPFAELKVGEINEFQAGPLSVQFIPQKLSSEDLTSPFICFKVDRFLINGVEYDLSDSPLLLSEEDDPICYKLGIEGRKFLSSDYPFEIHLPFIPNSLLKILILMHELGHVNTLDDFEEPSVPFVFGLGLLCSKLRDLSPQEILDSFIKGNYPEIEIDQLQMFSKYFRDLNMYKFNREKAANTFMVHEIRQFYPKNSAEGVEIEAAIKQVVAVNVVSRFKPLSPFINAESIPGAKPFVELFDENVFLKDGLDIRRIDHIVDDGYVYGRNPKIPILENHTIIDGCVQPNDIEAETWAGLKYFRDSSTLSSFNLDSSNWCEADDVQILPPQSENGYNILRSTIESFTTGSILEIVNGGESRQFVVRLRDQTEFGLNVEIIDADGNEFGLYIENNGIIDSYSLAISLDISSPTKMSLYKPKLSAEQIATAKQELLPFFSAMYPKQYLV
jgi:hypothetical protein